MKKLIVVFACIFLLPGNIYSQSDNELFELINESFLLHVDAINDILPFMVLDDPKNPFEGYFVELQNLPRGFDFSEDIWKLNFNGIYTNYNNKSLRKLLRKPKTVIFTTIKLKNDEIEIGFSHRTIQYKKGSYRHAAGAFWTTAYWKYSFTTNRWQLTNTESGGI